MKRGRPQPALKEVASMVATIIIQRAGNRVGHGGRAGASKHREEQDTGLESLDAGPAPRRKRVGKNDVAMIASHSWRRRKSIIFPLPSYPLSFPSDHKHEPHRSRADANQNENRRKQRGRCVMIYPTRIHACRPRFVQRTSWTDDAIANHTRLPLLQLSLCIFSFCLVGHRPSGCLSRGLHPLCLA